MNTVLETLKPTRYRNNRIEKSSRNYKEARKKKLKAKNIKIKYKI